MTDLEYQRWKQQLERKQNRTKSDEKTIEAINKLLRYRQKYGSDDEDEKQRNDTDYNH